MSRNATTWLCAETSSSEKRDTRSRAGGSPCRTLEPQGGLRLRTPTGTRRQGRERASGMEDAAEVAMEVAAFALGVLIDASVDTVAVGSAFLSVTAIKFAMASIQDRAEREAGRRSQSVFANACEAADHGGSNTSEMLTPIGLMVTEPLYDIVIPTAERVAMHAASAREASSWRYPVMRVVGNFAAGLAGGAPIVWAMCSPQDYCIAGWAAAWEPLLFELGEMIRLQRLEARASGIEQRRCIVAGARARALRDWAGDADIADLVDGPRRDNVGSASRGTGGAVLVRTEPLPLLTDRGTRVAAAREPAACGIPFNRTEALETVAMGWKPRRIVRALLSAAASGAACTAGLAVAASLVAEPQQALRLRMGLLNNAEWSLGPLQLRLPRAFGRPWATVLASAIVAWIVMLPEGRRAQAAWEAEVPGENAITLLHLVRSFRGYVIPDEAVALLETV